MAEKLKRKLKNTSGETITEVLVALLISALALILLAGMINATANMVSTSETFLNNYLAGANRLADQSGTENGSGTVTLKIGTEGRILTDSESDVSVPVLYYTNSTWADTPVTAYKKQG